MASPDPPCPPTTTSKPPSSKPRRRARKACIGCRTRKVRCDVTMKGVPCTNCQLDSINCVVKERATRRLLAIEKGTKQAFNCSRVSPMAEDDELEPFVETDGFADATQGPSDEPGQVTGNLLRHSSSDTTRGFCHGHNSPRRILGQTDDIGASQHIPPSLGFPDMDTVLRRPSNVDSEFDGCGAMMLLYTAYPFLAVNNLAGMSSQDLAFLQVKGAFHVPAKPILDEFVRQYFLQVHPFLPIMDEGDFWSVYRQDGQSRSAPTVPLIVFQAMLFASSSFVPEAMIASLGYDKVRYARGAFYRNAKILYDLSTEESPIAIAQTALLMTLWSPPEPKAMHSNSMWLHIAIQHAQHVDAHLAWETPISPTVDNLDPRQEPQMLRRLWWCCLIRDRFMALGLRRSLQIRKQQPILYISDFEREIGRSEVHDVETKQALVLMFLRLTHLCNILVDLVVALSPSDNSSASQHQSSDIPIKCRNALHSWYEKTQREMSAWPISNRTHEHAVVIHRNVLFIFYNAARSVTLRQEILFSCYPADEPGLETLNNYERSQELEDAVVGTVGCLRTLAQLDLSRYLPLSILAFITVPLLFHILDVKVLCPETSDEVNLEARYCRLRVLIDTLKEQRPRYDGIEWISHALRYAVNLAQVHSASVPKSSVGSWGDLLTQQPSFCLRLALTVDLSISKVKIPEDRDFPVVLRGSLRPSLSLGRSLSLKSPNPNSNIRAVDFQDLDFERFLPRGESQMIMNHMKHASHRKDACSEDHYTDEASAQIGQVNSSENHVDKNERTIPPGLTSIDTQIAEPDKNVDQQSNPNDEILSQPVMEPFDISSADNTISVGCDLETLVESDLEEYWATSNAAVSTEPN